MEAINSQDSAQTWDTDNPDFTPCFQNTVLLWVPCAWLCLASMVYLPHLILNNQSYSSYRTWKLATKTILSILLCTVAILDFINSVGNDTHSLTLATLQSPVVRFVAVVCTCSDYNHKILWSSLSMN